MRFEDFIKEGKVRIADVDDGLIQSLLKTAEEDYNFFNKIELNEISARKLVSNFYDILRAILEAFAIKKGYKIYSHEAFASFLIEFGENDIAEKFDRFRKIRNKINYYGKDISKEEAKEYVGDIKKLIKFVKEKF